MAEPLRPIKELGYFVKRESLLVTSKGMAVPTAEVIAPSVEGLVGAGGIEGTGAALGGAANGALLGVLTTGLAVAIAAGVSQMDYRHKRDVLKDLYKEELAAQLGKSKDKVTTNDLDAVAKSNRVLAEELKRSKRQRNWGIGIAFIATMAAITFVSAVMAAPAIVGALASIGLVEGGGLLASIGIVALHALTGYAAFKAVETPVEWMADKAFGLHKKITNDYIVEIERAREAGKTISREQVMSVFVSANPELDRMIVNNFGKHFDDLSAPDKQRATEKVSQIIPLEKLTLDLNKGIINPSELAFAVEGKRSGVERNPQEGREIRRGLRGMLEGVGEKIEQTQIGQKIEKLVAPVVGADPFEDEHRKPTKSFVERLGRGRRGEAVGFADGVEQSRADQSVSLQRS